MELNENRKQNSKIQSDIRTTDTEQVTFERQTQNKLHSNERHRTSYIRATDTERVALEPQRQKVALELQRQKVASNLREQELSSNHERTVAENRQES